MRLKDRHDEDPEAFRSAVRRMTENTVEAGKLWEDLWRAYAGQRLRLAGLMLAAQENRRQERLRRELAPMLKEEP